MRQRPFRYETKSIGDIAVDGLFFGFVAGIGMSIFLAILAAISGKNPIDVIGGLAIIQLDSVFSRLVEHMAIASVYGILFSIAFRAVLVSTNLAIPAWLVGIVFGSLLVILNRTIILTGTYSPMAEFNSLLFVAAHIVYGTILGGLFDLQNQDHD